MAFTDTAILVAVAAEMVGVFLAIGWSGYCLLVRSVFPATCAGCPEVGDELRANQPVYTPTAARTAHSAPPSWALSFQDRVNTPHHQPLSAVTTAVRPVERREGKSGWNLETSGVQALLGTKK